MTKIVWCRKTEKGDREFITFANPETVRSERRDKSADDCQGGFFVAFMLLCIFQQNCHKALMLLIFDD